MIQWYAARQLESDVGKQCVQDLVPTNRGVVYTEQRSIYISKQPGVLVGLASQHDPIHECKMSLAFAKIPDTPVDDDRELWKIILQLIDPRVV